MSLKRLQIVGACAVCSLFLFSSHLLGQKKKEENEYHRSLRGKPFKELNTRLEHGEKRYWYYFAFDKNTWEKSWRKKEFGDLWEGTDVGRAYRNASKKANMDKVRYVDRGRNDKREADRFPDKNVVRIYKTYFDNDPKGYRMAAMLLHEYLHTKTDDNWKKLLKDCTNHFNWNELRSYAAEAFILGHDFNQEVATLGTLMAAFDDYMFYLNSLQNFLGGLTKPLTGAEWEAIDRLKRALREMAKIIKESMGTLGKLRTIAAKLRGLRDGLLSTRKNYVIIKNYNPGNPDDPNCALNWGKNKEIKAFVNSLNGFAAGWTGVEQVIVDMMAAINGLEQLLQQLNMWAECIGPKPDLNPWIKYIEKNVDLDKLPSLDPKPASDVVKRSDDEMKGKRKKHYVAPFLTEISTLTAFDGVVEVRLDDPERGSGRTLRSVYRMWALFADGELEWISDDETLEEKARILVWIHDRDVLAEIVDHPDGLGLALESIRDRRVSLVYQENVPIVDEILEDLIRIRNRTDGIPKCKEVNRILDAAIEVGHRLSERARWIGGVFLKKGSGGFRDIATLVALLVEAKNEWKSAWGRPKARRMLSHDIRKAITVAEDIFVDGRFFGISREMERGEVDDTIDLHSSGHAKLRAGDLIGGIGDLEEAWTIVSGHGPDTGVGLPKLLNMGFSNRPRFKAIGWSTDPGAMVQVFLDGEVIGEGLADRSGGFEFEAFRETSDGLHTIWVSAEDEEGNQVRSAPAEIVFDTFTPTPEVTYPPAGGVIQESTPFIEGWGVEPGAAICVFLKGFVVSTTADPTGYFSVQVTEALDRGVNELQVNAVDDYGNLSYSESMTFYVGERIEKFRITYPTALLMTHETAMEVRGRGAMPGNDLELIVDADAKGFVHADDAGEFVFHIDRLPIGDHWMYVGGLDGWGEFGMTETVMFKVCERASPPMILHPTPGSVVPPGILTVTGDACMREARVYVWLDGEFVGDALSQRDGQFVVKTETPLKEGTHSLFVRVVRTKGRPAFADVEFEFTCSGDG